MKTNSNVKCEITNDEVTGLNKAEVTLALPSITVTCYAADKDDLRYKVQSAFNEIVDEIIASVIER